MLRNLVNLMSMPNLSRLMNISKDESSLITRRPKCMLPVKPFSNPGANRKSPRSLECAHRQ